MNRVQVHNVDAHPLAFSAVLDALSVGILLLDGRGRVVEANHQALRLAARGDGLTIGADGRLAATSSEDTRRIADVVGRALRRDEATGGALCVPRGEGERPYALVVAPASRPALRGNHGHSRALAVVTDTGEEPTLSTDRVASVLGLTHGEAAVALGLSQGKTLEEIATALGIVVSTVRTHLKHIYAKTGTSRQGQVVSLVFRCGLGTLR